MAQVLGYRSRLVIDFESAYGTDPVTPAGLVMPVNTFNLRSSRRKVSAATITGSRNPVAPFDGNLVDSGEGVIPVDANAMAYWLRAMFGLPSSSGSGPTYSHEFTVGDSMPSFISEIRFATASAVVNYAKHNGCKISSLSMTVGGDDELVANIGIEAQTETHGTSAYDSSPTTLSLDRLNNFQAAITQGGSPLANVTELSFNIDFGLATDMYVIGGGGVRGDLPEGLLSVTGSLTALFENMTLLNLAMNSTETSLSVAFTNATSSHSLTFEFPEIQLERNTPGIEGPQGVVISLPWVAYMDDDAAESAVVCTLVNDTETYA